jgi:acetyltransferase-like isoleucine patch superfamily enzyme
MSGDQIDQFAGIGQDVTIWPLAKIVGRSAITIGDSVMIDDFAFLMGGTRTTIGSFVHIASFVLIAGGGELKMGDFSALSGGCRVYTGNDDYLGNCLTNPTVPEPYRRALRSFVHIGRHAIVGANCVLLPGVTVGEGAAIGASSLVTRDCEPWTVYAGSPARPFKPRPRERMLALEADLRTRAYDADGQYRPKVTWDLPT